MNGYGVIGVQNEYAKKANLQKPYVSYELVACTNITSFGSIWWMVIGQLKQIEQYVELDHPNTWIGWTDQFHGAK